MGTAVSLSLREPKYQETAAYCHFGRTPYTKDGIKLFEWENAKDLSKYKGMTSEQVSAELKNSNYLTKWVDRGEGDKSTDAMLLFSFCVVIERLVSYLYSKLPMSWIHFPCRLVRKGRLHVVG